MNRRLLWLLPVMAIVPFCACATLSPAPETTLVARPAPTVPLEVCWVEVAGTSAATHFGAAGWTTSKEGWDATASVLVVRHPKGDVLIDTGTSLDATQDDAELGAWKRFVRSQTAGRMKPRGALRPQLEALGVVAPVGLIVSHAHPDHAGGVDQVPNAPVWLAKEEQAFVDEELATLHGTVVAAHARALAGRMVPFTFESGPFLTYEKSHDVFGDGSVVVVPTFGHTPGSVATVVTLPDGQRLMHVGDLVSRLESIERRVPKYRLMRLLTDEDGAATDREVAKLSQLHEKAPALKFLPAHDRRAYEAVFGKRSVGGAPTCLKAAPVAEASRWVSPGGQERLISRNAEAR